jgi:hypothetical protein
MTELRLCGFRHAQGGDLDAADTAPRHEVGNRKPTIYGFVAPHVS